MRGSTVPLAPVSQKVGLTGAGFVGRRFQKKNIADISSHCISAILEVIYHTIVSAILEAICLAK